MSVTNAVALRRFIYDELIATGLPPSTGRIAAHFRVTRDAAKTALAEMKIGKTVLVHPTTGEIWMAGPFAAKRTPYEIARGAIRWWANCAWDLLGVAAIVGPPVALQAACTDCGLTFSMEVGANGPPPSDWVVHFLLPASRWYDDIGFT
jgi:alkylmercury lyase-like protein